MEEGSERWSKPHVGTLSLHSLFELRSLLLTGSVFLDMNARCLSDITDLVLDDLVNKNVLPYDKRAEVKKAIESKHRHQYQRKKSEHKGLPIIKSLAEIASRNFSSANLAAQAATAAAVPVETSGTMTTNTPGHSSTSSLQSIVERNEVNMSVSFSHPDLNYQEEDCQDAEKPTEPKAKVNFSAVVPY